MRADGIDPRDITWEDDRPTYRVYFWDRPEPSPPTSDALVGTFCDAYRVTDAHDVHEVFTWAQSRVVDYRSYVLYVETNRNFNGNVKPGLLRLFGTDPTADRVVGPEGFQFGF